MKDRANVAWSNLFKQGVTRGNPNDESAQAQRDDSVRLLRQEMDELHPDLIVLVNAGYWEEISKEAFDIIDGETVEDGDGKLREIAVPGETYAIWSRPAYGGIPPILWMQHPQGKTTTYLEAAIGAASQLTGWTGI